MVSACEPGCGYADLAWRPGAASVILALWAVLENERDKLVVILAGDQDRMDGFFAATSPTGCSSHILASHPQLQAEHRQA